ncbi:hypothetical protein YC2023_005591 [Brassica napus]
MVADRREQTHRRPPEESAEKVARKKRFGGERTERERASLTSLFFLIKLSLA